jgi:TonB family protein
MSMLMATAQLVSLLTVQPSDWLVKPSQLDMMRYYPERAISGALGGDVTINCRVGSTLRLEDCKVIAETPVHVGFGDAALRIAPLYVLRPQILASGESVVGARVTVPVKFRLGPTPSASTTTV